MNKKEIKIKIVQQALNPIGIGGVSSEFRALINSNLNKRYDFIPLILKECNRGINIKDIRFYYKEISKLSPDIIHVRGAAVDGLNAIIAAKLANNCKILVSVHGMYSDLVYISKLKKFIAKNIIEKIIFTLADGISCVCNSASNRDIFKRYNKKMLPFVYNRTPDWSMYDRKEIREITRKNYDISDNEIVGIYCGRITREKGMDYLINALIRLENEWPNNFRMFIVGDGDYLDTLKCRLNKLIQSKKIICTGCKKNVYEYIFASDFFIQPSLHENHSISLIEACIGEIPSIATSVGGNTEIVDDKYTGIIIKPYDTIDLYNAIKFMIDNEGFRIRAGKLAKKEALKRFNDAIIDKQLDKVYQCLYSKE